MFGLSPLEITALAAFATVILTGLAHVGRLVAWWQERHSKKSKSNENSGRLDQPDSFKPTTQATKTENFTSTVATAAAAAFVVEAVHHRPSPSVDVEAVHQRPSPSVHDHHTDTAAETASAQSASNIDSSGLSEISDADALDIQSAVDALSGAGTLAADIADAAQAAFDATDNLPI